MSPTIISRKASNWVDRGEAPHPTIERVLARFLERNAAADASWFHEQAEIIIGMVAADATEVHVVGFLRSLQTEGSPLRDSMTARLAAVALWHAAKAALVRDTAERVLNAEPRTIRPTPDALGHWLATRLLTPDQAAAFEAQARAVDEDPCAPSAEV